MTHIEQAIREAVGKGGYELPMSMNWYATTPNEREQLRTARLNVAFLDPLFWQALGKARGWETKFVVMSGLVEEGIDGPLSGGEMEKWRYEWHRFIDHLAEGKDAESFFENLK